MNEKAEILRGEGWAGRLQGHLAVPPNNIDDWMTQNTQRVKTDEHCVSGLLRLGGGLSHLKYYAHKSALRRFFTRDDSHRAVRAYEAAAVLRSSGVAVPRPRACLKIRDGFLLLTKGIEESETLDELWRGGLAQELAGHLMWSAGAELAQVHLAGYCHGDCKWNNILWSSERVYLIDLDDARSCRTHGRRQMKDLARFTLDAERLNVSSWYYQRFLNSYLGVMKSDKEEVEQRMLRPLNKLRKRHRKKYGAYAQELV